MKTMAWCILFDYSLFSCFHMFTGYEIPSSVFIGGLFRVVDPIPNENMLYFGENSHNLVQQDKLAALYLASFVMAVDQINNKTDGIFDYLLPNTTIKMSVDVNQRFVSSSDPNYYLEGSQSAYNIQQQVLLSNDNLGVLGVVNTLNDAASMSSIGVYSGWKISTITVNSSLTDFSHNQNYPYNVRIIPSDSFPAVLMLKILQKFRWNKIALIYTTDTLGLDSYTMFSYAIQSSKDTAIEFLSRISYPVNQQNLTSVLSPIQSSGATIFVIFMSDQSAVQFLLAASAMGLLSVGTQVLGTAFSQSLDAFHQLDINPLFTSSLLQGYLTVKHGLDLYYQNSAGQAFLQEFRRLPPTININNNGSISCNQRKDDTIASDGYLYQYTYHSSNPDKNFSQHPYCLGIESYQNYTSNDNSNNMLDPSVMYPYNAVVLFALVIDAMIRAYFPLTADEVHSVFTQYLINSQLPLSIGNVSIFSGIPLDDDFGKGDRIKGHIYYMLNYDSLSNHMIPVGTIDDGNGVLLCSDVYSYICYNIFFRTYPNGQTIPSDQQPDKYVYLNTSVKITFLFFGILCIATIIITTLFYLYYHSTKAIHNSQLKLVLIISVASIIGGVRILLTSVDITKSVCITILWLEQICFRLFFGTYMLKLWRIHRIINTTGIKRMKITEEDIIKYILGHVSLIVLLLVAITAINETYVAYYITTSANQNTLQPICRYHNSTISYIFLLIIYITDIYYLITGIWYLFLTRAVPSVVNETKSVAPILIGSTIVVIVLAIIILAIGHYSEVTNNLLVTIGFIVILIPSNIIYFTQKFLLVQKELLKTLKDGRNHFLFGIGSNPIRTIAHSVTYIMGYKKDKIYSGLSDLESNNNINNSRGNDESNRPTTTTTTSEYQAAVRLIQTEKTYIDKVQLIQKHVDLWRSFLMRLADGDEDLSYYQNHPSNVPMIGISPRNRLSNHIISPITSGPIPPLSLSPHSPTILSKPTDHTNFDLNSPINVLSTPKNGMSPSSIPIVLVSPKSGRLTARTQNFFPGTEQNELDKVVFPTDDGVVSDISNVDINGHTDSSIPLTPTEEKGTTHIDMLLSDDSTVHPI